MLDKLKKSPHLVFLSVIAVAIQIQISLFQTETYLGLRINSADLLLPFSGLFIIYSLLAKKSAWPQWSMQKTWFWIAGLLVVMTLALVNGYINNGFLSQWAFINKYIGFYVLLSYLLLGGWLATNLNDFQASTKHFLQVFCGTYIVILVLSFLCAGISLVTPIPFTLGEFAWDGLMANRNAFMVLTIATILFIEVYRFSQSALFPPWVHALFWTIMPVFGLYNESRTGWIMGTIVILGLLIKNYHIFLRKILPFLLIGSCLTYAMYENTNLDIFKRGWHMERIMSVMNKGKDYDSFRKIAWEDGTELYKKSNPVIGRGLGSYREFQTKKRGEFVDILDFSALWLLAETGALGLLAFSGFFLSIVFTFYKKLKEEANFFVASMLCFLILIGAMSFLHELLYMRFLWLFLGMALAMPIKPSKS